MALYDAQIFITPLLHILVCLLLLGCFPLSTCSEADILCLKSIKQSIKDPFNHLNLSWTFNSTSEGFICGFSGVECWLPSVSKVFSISLTNMSLQGEFPRGIDKCTSLVGLDLSGNEFYGPIPSDIDKILPFVTNLDLSSNNFSGEIPSSVANMHYLNSVRLNNNHLKGHIPPQITSLSRIKYFSVTNNMLSGPLPNFVDVTFSYENNQGLCGKPLRRCREQRLPIEFDFSFESGFLIGYVVSVVSFIVVFVSYFVPWVQVNKGNQKITLKKMILLLMLKKKSKRRNATLEIESEISEFLLEESKEISMLEKFATRMSFMDLCSATDNFSEDNIIGAGKLGTVYRARLPTGWLLAVKRFHDAQHHKEHFISELQILRRLRHNNLIPLLGFSVESTERLLVYKYMSNGNLYDRLHSLEGEAKNLEWHLRVKIAVGLARGLAWLNHNSNVHVVNLKINSKSVLLDRNLEPKISNFGSAMLMQPSIPDSTMSPTPIWVSEFMKKDVHGFGTVLLELITGKEGQYFGTEYDSNSQLSSGSSDICDAIDRSLIGKGNDAEIFQFLKVAYDCLQPFVDHQKPTMLEVYNKLMAVGEKHGLTYDSQELAQTVIAATDAEAEIV